MVRVSKTGEKFIKLLYWGCPGSGKKTIVDTLYRLTKEGKYGEEVTPINDPINIAKAYGSSLYFDRGVLQSKKQAEIFYHIYTVASRVMFSPLLYKIFQGTDGVIFVFDSQRSQIEKTINSLKELKNIPGIKLNSEIQMLVMVNKQDLPNPIKKDEVEQILNDEGLFHYHNHDLIAWNPIIYETVAFYSNVHNVYEAFAELTRRIALYQADN